MRCVTGVKYFLDQSTAQQNLNLGGLGFGAYLANFKLTISDTAGKSINKELKDDAANSFVGMKIGDSADAAVIDLQGTITITGGSDKSGVPIRSDVHGSARKYVLLTRGVGLKAETGQRVRKLVHGNQISEEIYQINCRYDGKLESTDSAEKNQ